MKHQIYHKNKLKVLILDDEKPFTIELQELLQNSGFDAYESNTWTEAQSVLEKTAIDLLILDVRLSKINGLDVLKKVKFKYPQIEVIIVSAHGDMDTVIKAMRLGAIDYLRKPFRHIDIQIAIERTQKFLQLQHKIAQVEEKNSLISKTLEQKTKRNFIGESPKLKEVLELALTAAQYPTTNVLITGESGTGKENIARIIHYASELKENIFCPVNSSAITDTLLESEFFGHKKGSFTGAITDKKGFFEVSHNGTLFLDEIADMPLNLQAKILRAIEEKKITRVGDTEEIAVNFRIISATNRHVEQLVKQNKFRLDLLHRLNTLHIRMPSLRERAEDIEPLLLFFVKNFSHQLKKSTPQIDKAAIKALKRYRFPGNVRELKNMSERAVILCKENILTIDDFSIGGEQHYSHSDQKQSFNLKETEIQLIHAALKSNNYNQTAAAMLLGISRDALIRKMKKHNIFIKKKGTQYI
ncbi:sigma-54-dependent Fis family transcriptional regulator [Prolixibacteraceae bacterium JC049]|nr:sigma-54-dependent Fis family transcriptional regulator [Prolixibacteraceae bacterium JC049]